MQMQALQRFLLNNFPKFARQSPRERLGNVLSALARFARQSPRDKFRTVRCILGETDWYWKVHSPQNDRTAYVIGLFGTGRKYINELMELHIGERAKYLTQGIRFRRGRTSMVYSGHATIRYISPNQALPAVTSRVLKAARSGLADAIFIYRHPLDSLLTNWVWWRAYLRDHIYISGISKVYKNTDDLCAGLEQNFSDFVAFAKGDLDFFAPGLPFLSFPQFVEETELFLQSATLTLRIEDFVEDPLKEFSKIAEVMSVDLDLSSLQLARPISKPYGYLAVKEKVPRFRNFIDGLDAETKRRIEKIGYSL
jgi:hypothetical protein